MTDRVKGLVVTLDDDYRIDDVQEIVNAIKMVKGVATVDENITTIDDHMNRVRVKMELQGKLFEALRDE